MLGGWNVGIKDVYENVHMGNDDVALCTKS